ncbi:MAG: TlyA family RNA methyltransferase [Clostridia bacterium]|nr:TlyA family RNA methyltransferase [Clostridia bacterium]
MRADVYLTAMGYVASRKKAQDLIDGGAVTVDDQVVKKSSALINEEIPHKVEIEQLFRYVSRGGMKLEGALNAFGINVNRKKAVDVGASTGGFTDCLLQRGASRVIAIDSGIGQLHESLRADPRVLSVEQFNARELNEQVTEGPCDLAVMDVSFISSTYLIPGIASVLKEGGEFVSLIKPQFEAGKGALGKGGIVRNSAYRYLAIKRVLECAADAGFDCMGVIPSPIEGGDGNREYLAYFKKQPCLASRIEDRMLKRIAEL